MTQEEKAKRYDEAIERAKKHCADYVVETIFPELKESEDKKIKEWLIRLINTAGYRELDTDKMPCSRRNVIAWLEKQGEQKPAWSEEDERKIEELISLCKGRKKLCSPDVDGYSRMNELQNWLKSLKGRVQPKQELSEEDEIRLKHILRLLNVKDDKKYLLMFGLNSLQDLKKDISWLKSLRPQNRWKPSNEQMEALLYEVNAWDEDSVNGQNLKSLYQDLKKLMEE